MLYLKDPITKQLVGVMCAHVDDAVMTGKGAYYEQFKRDLFKSLRLKHVHHDDFTFLIVIGTSLPARWVVSCFGMRLVWEFRRDKAGCSEFA